MSHSKTRVLYILGWGRSGSTILDNILGQADGFFSCGELRYLWDRNLMENRLCGCGAPFSECDVWTDVMRRSFGGAEQAPVSDLIAWRDLARTRHLPLLTLKPYRDRLDKRLHGYRQRLAALYRAIADVSGCEFVVDSSKFPSYAYVLSGIEDIDLWIVHLVRDPRAVAYSWLRKKLQLDRGANAYLDRHNPLTSTSIWMTWNLAGEILGAGLEGRYARYRYEDFARAPRRVVDDIFTMVDRKLSPSPFVGDTTIELAPNHTVSGNPVRMRSGTTSIVEDDEWKSKLAPGWKLLINAMAWPLMARYGYRIARSGISS